MAISTRVIPYVRSLELGTPKDTYFGDQEFFEVRAGEFIERGEFVKEPGAFVASTSTSTDSTTTPTPPPANGGVIITEPPIGEPGPGGAGELPAPIGAAGTSLVAGAKKNPLAVVLLLIGLAAVGYYLYKRYKK